MEQGTTEPTDKELDFGANKALKAHLNLLHADVQQLLNLRLANLVALNTMQTQIRTSTKTMNKPRSTYKILSNVSVHCLESVKTQINN